MARAEHADPVKQEVCEKYISGKDTYDLAEEYDCSNETIRRWLHENDVTVSANPIYRANDQELIDEICDKYENGESVNSLSNEYQFSNQAIETVLEDNGIERRDIEQQYREDFPLDHDCFSELDSKTEYWIGFLLADGNVAKNNCEINLNLSGKDEDQVRKFKEFIGAENHRIREGSKGKSNQKKSRISVTSEQMKKDLIQYGVKPNKTGSERIEDDRLRYSEDFWRGVVDGDGWVAYNKRQSGKRIPAIGVCGTEDICESFKEFVHSEIVETGVNVRDHEVDSLFRITFRGLYVSEVISEVYYDGCVGLDRKKDTAKIITNSNDNLQI